MNRRPWLIPAVYVPGAILLAVHICAIALLQPSEILRFNLDRVEWIYLAAYFVAATVVFGTAIVTPNRRSCASR